MAYSLITVQNKSYADKIAHAFTNRFGANYSVHITPVEEMSFVVDYKLTAEYVGKKRETIPQVNINTVVFDEWALAYWTGWKQGFNEGLQQQEK